jgi:insertion element IS1 protein InsB
VNRPLITGLSPSHVEVVLQHVDEAEVDERWSFVGTKNEPRWLWHALDHRTGQVLAYVFGRRADEVCVKLKMGLGWCYTGNAGGQARLCNILNNVGVFQHTSTA